MLEIGEDGVAFRSYLDGSERFLGPEESMAVQAQLGSDIALAFDECTPYHADRDYTARSTERTHRWLDRCLEWHEREGPAGQAVFGIVQGGVYEDLRHESAEFVSAAGVDGVAIGGTLGRDKEEMRGVRGDDVPRTCPTRRPGTCWGSASPTTCATESGSAWTCSTAPCRPAWRGTGWRSRRCPADRHRFDIRKAEFARDESPLVEGCPCSTCAAHTRAYVHYLSRAEELTGVRLLVVHNLAYLERLVAGSREAIRDGRFGRYREAILAGAPPWAAGLTGAYFVWL